MIVLGYLGSLILDLMVTMIILSRFWIVLHGCCRSNWSCCRHAGGAILHMSPIIRSLASIALEMMVFMPLRLDDAWRGLCSINALGSLRQRRYLYNTGVETRTWSLQISNFALDQACDKVPAFVRPVWYILVAYLALLVRSYREQMAFDVINKVFVVITLLTFPMLPEQRRKGNFQQKRAQEASFPAIFCLWRWLATVTCVLFSGFCNIRWNKSFEMVNAESLPQSLLLLATWFFR